MVEASLIYTLGALVATLTWIIRNRNISRSSPPTDEPEPPWAPGPQLPLLGHALAYKASPPKFLLRAREACGPVFRINLAGMVTTVVSDASSMRAVATAPEATLSARDAISDFGFRYTLGDSNVFSGTDLHKQILKERVYPSGDAPKGDAGLALALGPLVLEGLRKAFPAPPPLPTSLSSTPTSLSPSPPSPSPPPPPPPTSPSPSSCVACSPLSTCRDFLGAMRRVAFHAVACHLVGTKVVEAYDRGGEESNQKEGDVGGGGGVLRSMLSLRKKRVSSFVDDFMEFQDSLEEATASGVTLPTCLAVPLVWRPVERKRGAIAARLAAALDRLLDKKEEGAAGGAGDGDGVWLRAALNTRNEKGEKAGEDGAPPAASEGAGRIGELSSHHHHLWAADLVMGLLFAAHKNPALAAAQTVLFALEHHKQQQGRQRQQQQQQQQQRDDDNDNDDDDDDNEDGLVVGTSTKAGPATTTTWLEKIQSESGGLVAAFGGDSTPALDACVKEALRLSAHSLGAVRKVKASFFAIPTNCEEEGNEASRKVYRVSEGSYVGVSHILPHLCDLKAFPDASSFRPERFLAPQKGHDNAAATASAAPAAAEEVEVEVAGSAVGMGSYQLTTFSHGIHVCPGQRYAMVLVKIMVAAVLDAPLACLSSEEGSAALLSSVVIPPLDFTRATLAQRSTKVSLPYSSAWR